MAVKSKINIRKARVRDIEALLPLYREFMDHHSRIDPLLRNIKNNKQESIKYLRKTIYGKETNLLLAEEDGQAIGFLGYGLAKRPEIFRVRDYGVIFDAFVARSRRRQGITRQMLTVAYDWFREKGIEHVELGVSSRNKTAVAAWDSLGFKNAFYRKRKSI